MVWPIKTSGAVTKGTEEDTVVVSKADLALVWAGSKVLYSGQQVSGTQASGYWWESGDVDIQAINESGWGHIRIPELSTVHKLFVFPKNPNINARVSELTGLSGNANIESGLGGISGNVALVHYAMVQGTSGFFSSGSICWWSGAMDIICGSGDRRMDVIAFGSIY